MKSSTGGPWCAGEPSAKRTTDCSSSPTPWTTPSSACAPNWKRITSSWIWTGWGSSGLSYRRHLAGVFLLRPVPEAVFLVRGQRKQKRRLRHAEPASHSLEPLPRASVLAEHHFGEKHGFKPLLLVLVVHEHNRSEVQRATAAPARRHLAVQVLYEPVGKAILTARAARLLAALGPAMRAGVDHRVLLRIAVQGGPAGVAHTHGFGRTDGHGGKASCVKDLHALGWMHQHPPLLHIGNTFASIISPPEIA